jgi:transcriptional regulator
VYRPPANRVDDLAVAVRIVRDHGFGHLVVAGPDGLDAVPVPVVVDVPDDSGGPDGRADRLARSGTRSAHTGLRVRAHVARSNPIWRAAPCPALLIVSPDDAYISPGFYPSKSRDPKVVPTWNYELVHVHGTLHARPDPVWLEALVRELTLREEATMATPWAVDDAPADFIERILRAIVGIELEVSRVEAKRKLSQNRSAEDVAGVVAALAGRDDRSAAVARAMADVTGTPPA